jgi:DNA-binding NtrC family response regulator
MPRGSVLVVDDEASILGTLKKALSLEGFSVDVAGGVGVAEERLGKKDYDLVLLDLSLPDGDGLELLERIRERDQNLYVIMMSGHGTIDAAVRATRLGALDFLEKPLSTDRLLVMLENALRLKRVEQEAHDLHAQAGHFDELLGSSRAMVALRDQVLRAARSNASVLVTGERGTGKELVARALHRASPRARAALERLNCAAVPAELIESELFGHEAGAFTGATKQRARKFERADGGTLFLDEVGDMAPSMQAKLLRVLEEREIERVGGSETLKVDVRVVAATNRDLRADSAAGTFRADLFDRLNVVPVEVPPLRARRGDIPELVERFLDLSRKENARPGITLAEGAVDAIAGHPFPGNVRELKNLVERLVILSPDDRVSRADVERSLGTAGVGKERGLYRAGVPFRVLAEDAERVIIEEALVAHGGQMAATARALGLERSHLYKKAKALGLRGDKDPEDEKS